MNTDEFSIPPPNSSNKETSISRHRNEKNELKCSECSYVSLYSGTLNRHFQSVHQKLRNFECDKCSYTSSLKPNLLRHMKNVHNNI